MMPTPTVQFTTLTPAASIFALVEILNRLFVLLHIIKFLYMTMGVCAVTMQEHRKAALNRIRLCLPIGFYLGEKR